jgi:hypothetical protein
MEMAKENAKRRMEVPRAKDRVAHCTAGRIPGKRLKSFLSRRN